MSNQTIRIVLIFFMMNLIFTACDRLPSLPKLPALPNPFSRTGQISSPSNTPEIQITPSLGNNSSLSATSTLITTSTSTPTKTPTPTFTYTPTPTLTNTPSPIPPPLLPISKNDIQGIFESLGFIFSESDPIGGLPVTKGSNSNFSLYLVGFDNDLNIASLEFSILGGKEVIQQSVIFLTVLFGLLIPEDAWSTLAWVNTQLNQLLEKGSGELDLGTARIKVENTGELFRISIEALP